MGQVKLKGITVKGIRSFVSESSIEFPESGMVLFAGHNHDTGGSSGSGKSTLLLAISYLFGFCRFPATALQSWLTEEPLEVTGTVVSGADELVICRGQKLSLMLHGKKVGGSAKELEHQITKFVGLAPDLLAALTYRGQKQPGLFLSKGNAEKQEFLSMLLDLGHFETAVEQSQAKAKTLEQQVHTEDFVATGLTKKISDYRSNFKPTLIIPEENFRSQLELAQTHQDRVRKQVLELRLKIRSAEMAIEREASRIRAAAEPSLAKLTERLEELHLATPNTDGIDHSKAERLDIDLKQAQGFLQAELAADQVRHQDQKQQSDSTNAKLVALEKKLATVPALEKKLAQLDKEIEKLGQDMCDRCLRTWDQAAAQKVVTVAQRETDWRQLQEIEALKPQVQQLQAEYKALRNFVPAPVIEELRTITADLAAQLAAERAEIQKKTILAGAELKTQVSDVQAQLQQLRLNISSQIDLYRANSIEKVQGSQDELETMERELLMSESQVKGITASLSRAQIDNSREAERAAQFEQTVNGLTNDLTVARASLAELTKTLNAELDFQRLIGREGFLGAIFDDVLWEISEETNRLLAQFPNTAHVTLHFRSEGTTQKGTIKKSINPVITIGGFEAPLSSGLSGGMETAVELAVDLAVATVVSRRTGASPGWLILDESFTGLGPVEQEGSMEILRAFAEDKLVLVVDHASEMKSMFGQHVDVDYRAGLSKVRA